MNSKKIFGVVLIVVGAILLFCSNYIASQVESGKLRIQSAQGKVDTANSAFSHSEYTKPIGNLFTGGAQQKIDAGQSEVDRYESLAHTLQIVGFILIAGGVIFLVLGFRKKRK